MRGMLKIKRAAIRQPPERKKQGASKSSSRLAKNKVVAVEAQGFSEAEALS